MPQYMRMTVLWFLLFALLTSCTPTVEPNIAGTWAVCHDGSKDGLVVFGGLVFDETVRFYENGTFHMYPKNTFLLESTPPQMSGEYKVLTVDGAATSAQGEMQLTLTSPAPLSVRVPYTYVPKSSERMGLLLLATNGDIFPCQSCLLCQSTMLTLRTD